MSDADTARCRALDEVLGDLSAGQVARWLGCSETAVRAKRAGALRVSDLDVSLLPPSLRRRMR